VRSDDVDAKSEPTLTWLETRKLRSYEQKRMAAARAVQMSDVEARALAEHAEAAGRRTAALLAAIEARTTDESPEERKRRLG
jgi:hypothetical protein